MAFQDIVRQLGKSADEAIGLRCWLRGEPRPPRGGFDLDGEKLIDWGWICVNLPKGKLRALEIGSGKSPIIPAMLALGYNVTAVDLSMDISSIFGGVKFHYGDFVEIERSAIFDVIVLCSVVEHIGISGRYNSQEDPEGDLKAMRKASSMLDENGLLFLTIPVGKDVVHRPWHRVYGRTRLQLLLEEFEIVQSRFLVKSPWGPWQVAAEKEALSFGPDIQRYALGQFVLRKEKNQR
jgi:hypothetical protein